MARPGQSAARRRVTRMRLVLPVRFRVLNALVLREMTTRYGKSHLGYIWAILEPIAYIAIFSALFGFMSRHPPLGQNFPVFFATGVLPFFFFRMIADSCSSAFANNRTLLTYPQVTLLDAILGRFILEFTTRVLVSVLTLYGLITYYSFDAIYALGPIMAAPLLLAGVGIGTGMINCVLFNLSGTYQRVYMLLSRPQVILSGVIFIPERLPAGEARELILLNPLVHMIAYFRTGFYPTYAADYINFPMMISFPIALIVIGMFLIRRFEGRLL